MPSYKTHSIHAEQSYDYLVDKISIPKESLKVFAGGPDLLIGTDYETFNRMHDSNVKDYFEALLKYYKENKLLENGEAMAFLYGQLDHYMLDVFTHPLIYYLTEKLPKDYLIGYHGLVEMWIDDYITTKYDKEGKKYFRKCKIDSEELKGAIDTVTKSIYGTANASKKYENGMKMFTAFESARNNKGIVPVIDKVSNLGNITYGNDLSHVLPFLNEERRTMLNPETGEAFNDSFDDLFNKSLDEYRELVHDVIGYLYNDKPLKNFYIANNISYNTGLNCSLGQTFKYCKLYSELDKLAKVANPSLSSDIKRELVVLTPIVISMIMMRANNSVDVGSILTSISGVLGVGIHDLYKSISGISEAANKDLSLKL